MSLADELGPARTAKEIAEIFSVDPRTVRKYPEFYGGVQVAPGVYRFFDNRIREIVYANENGSQRSAAMESCGKGSRQDSCFTVVRPGREGEAQSNHMGGGRKKADPGGEQEADPHGIFNHGRLGDKLSR